MFLGPGYHFWLFLVCSSWWESPGFSMSTWPLWWWLPGPGSPNRLRAAKPNPPNLRRLRCCRRPFFPTSRLHLQCSLILSPDFSYFDLYRPFVSISGKLNLGMIYCCIADIKTWDLCAMMRHAGELPVRQGCGEAFQATQQIFPSSRMV